MADGGQGKVLAIRLKRSAIGGTRRQRETLRGLGLNRLGKTVRRHDSPSLQGMIQRVLHLIEVDEQDEYGS